MFRIKFFFFCLCLIINVSGFIRNGWYRTDDSKSKKIITSPITSFNASNDLINKKHHLKIKSNRYIEALPKGAIRNLSDLIYLDMANSNIKALELDCFENLPNLLNLHLEDNDIEVIDDRIFNKLPSLEYLLLHRNKISQIASSAFDNMAKLRLIKLNANKLTTWDPNWFQNTPHLMDLYFRRNSIEYLPDGAFQNLIKEQQDVEEENSVSEDDLRLFLSKNDIKNFHKNAFKGLTRLGQLWVDRNKLTSFPVDLFKNFIKIGLLVVHSNDFTEINTQLFRNLKTPLEILDYSTNHVPCIDLDLLKFAKIIIINNRKVDCPCIEKVNKYLYEQTQNLSSPIRATKCNVSIPHDDEYTKLVD